MLPAQVAVPLVRSSVEDQNFDGRADALKLHVDGAVFRGLERPWEAIFDDF